MAFLRSRKAFTLPELLLTAAILAYSISVMLTTFINAAALNEASRNLTTAVSHGEFVLEDIRNAAFGSVAAGITAGNWNWNTAAITGKGMSALNGESIAVTSSGSNPVDLTVTVSWNDLNSRSRSRSLMTSLSG